MTLRRIALVVFGLSLLFSLARIPHATWSKRLRQVALHEELGPIGYHIGRTWPKIADDVRWIRDHTAEDAVILWRGHWKGPIELLVAAIGERVLFAESLWSGRSEIMGRPVARGSRDGRRGTLVVVADGPDIRLEFVP